MEFQWVAGLTLWTVLSGPVLVDLAARVSPVPPTRPTAVHTQAHAAWPQPTSAQVVADLVAAPTR